MKKTIAVIVVLALLVIAGFWWYSGSKNANVGVGTGDESNIQEESTGVIQDSASEEPVSQFSATVDVPSFEDGDIYLKAVGAKDAKMCDKISNTALKAKCKTKVQ